MSKLTKNDFDLIKESLQHYSNFLINSFTEILTSEHLDHVLNNNDIEELENNLWKQKILPLLELQKKLK